MQNTDNAVHLRAEHISKRFGGVQALEDAQFSCIRGETHVLIGENGAGKSTLVKILCGVVSRDEGSIWIDGQPAQIASAADAGRHRIAAVFQELSLIQDLSVAENIFLGREPINRLGQIHFARMYEEAGAFIKSLGLSLSPRMLVRDLSLCDKQLVEIAKALYKDPEILILDEATSALGEREVQWLFEKMRAFTARNNTVLFISHRMDELHKVADRATIFRDARYILTFRWGELSDNDIVAYISGKSVGETSVRRNRPLSDEVALETRGACRRFCLRNVSFQARKGEILGIAGLSGHGQVALLHALFGDGPLDAGSIYLEGRRVQIRSERDALRHGIALVTEDRKNEGLALIRPVSENITMMSLPQIQRFGVLQGRKERRNIQDCISSLRIKVNDVRSEVSSLSGGNQQKVVIAKTLLTGAKVLLFSDPTRGIDIHTKNEIYALMTRLAAEGMTILFYTTEITELLLLCSRVLVFYEGGVRAELAGEEITEENIIASSIGVGGKAYEC